MKDSARVSSNKKVAGASSSKAQQKREQDAPTTLVPKLRFPEFHGTAGWESKRLSSVGQLTRGLTYSSEDVAPTGLLVLRSTNIQDRRLVLDHDLVFVGKPCPEALRLQTGDIVICMSNGSKALVGKSGEYPGGYEGDITVGAFCSFFRPEIPFAKIAFHLSSYQKYIADLIAGGNINNLTNSVLEEFSFPVPPLSTEQQKIAECLSSLDLPVAAQARKVDALKTHKKGLMQQLFPREGETQPRLRFPEFKNAGEWEISELGSLCDVRDGTHDSPEFFPMGHPLVTSKNLRADGTLDLENVSLISEEDYEQINKRSKVKIGDILFGMIGTIGNPVQITSEGFAIKNVALIKELGPLSNAFLVQLLQSGYMAAIFAVLNTGNSQKFIALGKIRGLPIPVPPLPEQHRIASCLGSLDALIAAETHKLAALKTHKKGLMQQLFPSPEDVAE